MKFLVNGSAVEIDYRPEETLLEVLRDQLGITSPKDGCSGQG